jgi:transcriptional/translational regulatory protein YebC/TACO1
MEGTFRLGSTPFWFTKTLRPDADIGTPGCVKWWYQQKAVVHLFADEIAE